jgi:hypothetical protein
VREPGRTADRLGCAPPDFLLRFVALMNFIRLSLRKGAHEALSIAAWQEIRVGMTKGRVVTFIRGQSDWMDRKETAGPSTSLRFGRDDNFV